MTIKLVPLPLLLEAVYLPAAGDYGVVWRCLNLLKLLYIMRHTVNRTTAYRICKQSNASFPILGFFIEIEFISCSMRKRLRGRDTLFFCETSFWVVDQQTRTCDQTLRGSLAPTTHRCPQCIHAHIYLIFGTILLNHLNMLKTQILATLLIASGLLNWYTIFFSELAKFRNFRANFRIWPSNFLKA